jgi:hypothetical protein
MPVKTAPASKVQRKIQLLEALINHPNTPEPEREAARRSLNGMVKKLEAIQDQLPADSGHYWSRPDVWYGENYISDYRVSTVDIAAHIRADLKVRRNLGKKTANLPEDAVSLAVRDVVADAPASIKFSIRSEYFSGGSSIDITIKGVPQEWGWELDPEYDPHDYRHSRKWVETPALKALKAEIERVQQSYNHDGSDSRVDYYDKRFYGHTDVDWRDVPRD